MSINAKDPERVATFLATLMDGNALPFPPFPDSWIAFSGADDGTAIEVYPLTHRLLPGTDQVACDIGPAASEPSFAHCAIRSAMPTTHAKTLAESHGWIARRCNRGPFSCLEIWLENRVLVEVLDPEMQADYRRGMTVSNWRSMFGLP